MACRVPTAHRLSGLIALVVVLAVGCGKKGPPRPPEPRSPRAPEAVTARQIGGEFRVWFTVPLKRGERPSHVLVRAELVRVDYSPGFSPPPDPDVFRRRGEIVGVLESASLPVAGERIGVGDAAVDALADGGIGSTLRYAVRLYDVRDRPGPLVVATDLVPVEPLPPPVALAAEATGDGIRVTWTSEPVTSDPDAGVAEPVPGGASDASADPGDEPAAPAAEGEASDADQEAGSDAAGEPDDPQELPRLKYNVYRGAPDNPEPELPINPVPLTDTEYLDTDPVEGETYRYVIRMLLADGRPRRESASSLPIVVLASDLIAPQPPTGLVAVQEGVTVRLFWHPNAERDVAGYRVYRRLGRGPWEQVGPALVEQMTFIDSGVLVGFSLAYRVSAVDRANPPNESAPSDSTEIDLVAEPTAPGDGS